MGSRRSVKAVGEAGEPQSDKMLCVVGDVLGELGDEVQGVEDLEVAGNVSEEVLKGLDVNFKTSVVHGRGRVLPGLQAGDG